MANKKKLPDDAPSKYIDGREVVTPRQHPSTAQLNEAAQKFWSDPVPNQVQAGMAVKTMFEQRDRAYRAKGNANSATSRRTKIADRDRLIRELSAKGMRPKDIARDATMKPHDVTANLVRQVLRRSA
jgi:hypothetical protein